MNPAYELIIFAVVWLLVVPPAAALIATDIAEEKIFERFLAWIDLKFRGTLLAYLVRCPVCLSHWVVGILALCFWRQWESLPFNPWLNLIVVLLSIGAAVRFSKFWIK